MELDCGLWLRSGDVSGLELDIRVSSHRVVEWWWYKIKVVIVISHVTSTLTITTLDGRATFSTAHIGKA